MGRLVFMHKDNLGIREIAKIAGVSVATVSRVINTPDKTAPATREKVRAVIERYQYVPNLTARDMYGKDSNSFALFVYDLENPFFISLIKELHKIALQHKRTLLICDTESDAAKEREYFLYCKGIRVQGIIVTEGYENFFSNDTTNYRIAVMDRKGGPHYSCVRSDNRSGVITLVDYLYNLNHRRFGFAGLTDNIFSCAERKCWLQDISDTWISPSTPGAISKKAP